MERIFEFKDKNVIFKLVNAAAFYSEFNIIATTNDEIKIIDSCDTIYYITSDRIVIQKSTKYITPSILEAIVCKKCDEIKPEYVISLSRYQLRYIQDIIDMLNDYSFNTLKYEIEHMQDVIDIIAWAALPNQPYEIVSTDTSTIEIKHRGRVVRIWDNRIATTIPLNKSLMAYIHEYCLDISGNTTISIDLDTVNELVTKLKARHAEVVAISLLKTIEEQLP